MIGADAKAYLREKMADSVEPWRLRARGMGRI
jgi:hypothetical protein